MSPAPIKCCYCRDPIYPVDGEWVGVLSGSPTCRSPLSDVHARQIVFVPDPNKQDKPVAKRRRTTKGTSK